jgi:hypothetical protein
VIRSGSALCCSCEGDLAHIDGDDEGLGERLAVGVAEEAIRSLVVATAELLTAQLSSSERDDVFAGTASHVYALSPP